MTTTRLQFGMRGNTASPRQHASRLPVGTKSRSHFIGEENAETTSTVLLADATVEFPFFQRCRPAPGGHSGDEQRGKLLPKRTKACFNCCRAPVDMRGGRCAYQGTSEDCQTYGSQRRFAWPFPVQSLVFLRVRTGLMDANRVTFVPSLAPLEQEKHSCLSGRDISSAIYVVNLASEQGR